MISPHYLPVDFTFRDPSKMKKFHYQSLLEHWYTRQEDDGIDIVFTFRGYWDPTSDSVIAVTDKHPKKRRTAPGSIARNPKRGNAEVARKADASRKRPGPPGIRKGDRHWPNLSGEDENEVNEEGEDEDEEDDENANDEDDNGNNSRRQRVMPLKAPKALPFAATRMVPRGAPVALKKNAGRLPAVADKSIPTSKAPPKKARADVQTSENVGDQALQTDEIRAAVTKRPQPRPAYRRRQGDDAAPAAIKEKPARKAKPSDLGPRSEPPVTRSGGKRKAGDAELQAIGESSTKKGKRKAK
jgi:hypothetical protein